MLFLISSPPPQKKITRESFLHVFFHTRSNTFSYVERKRISRCDYTWIRSRRAITGLFARPLSTFFFFSYSHMFRTCMKWIINSRRTIGITREKDQRFIFQRSFIIFLCREFDKKKKKRIMARDNFPSHNGRQCFKNYFKINLAGEISRSLSLSCSDPRLNGDMFKTELFKSSAINNWSFVTTFQPKIKIS